MTSPGIADYAAFLPAAWRERTELEPTTTWWSWRGHTIHVLRRVHPDAPVRGLLAHGAGGHSTALWPIASLLPVEHFDLAAVDLPLHGETTSPGPAAVRYQDWVELLCDFVLAEDDDRPLVLLGASIGGMFAYEVAARRSPRRRRGDLPARPTRPGLSRLCAADPRGGRAKVPLGFLTSFLTYRHTPLEQMRIPVTLAHPAKDAWTPVEISTRWLRRIAAPCDLVMLGECGHFPIEDPGLRDLVDAVERAARLARHTDS